MSEATAPEEKSIDFTDVDPAELEKKLAFTKSFMISYKNPDDGRTYSGRFTCKRPTLGDVTQIGIIKSRLLMGEKLNRELDYMNEMLAYCQVCLTEVPDWWNPEQSYDPALLVKVYEYVRHWESSFRR